MEIPASQIYSQAAYHWTGKLVEFDTIAEMPPLLFRVSEVDNPTLAERFRSHIFRPAEVLVIRWDISIPGSWEIQQFSFSDDPYADKKIAPMLERLNGKHGEKFIMAASGIGDPVLLDGLGNYAGSRWKGAKNIPPGTKIFVEPNAAREIQICSGTFSGGITTDPIGESLGRVDEILSKIKSPSSA